MVQSWFITSEVEAKNQPNPGSVYSLVSVPKAIHLEPVMNLTTETFLATFRSFVSRRDPCSEVFGDCGTNFNGVNNELKEVYRFLKLNNDDIHPSLLKENISWHFNPPASPHQGGLWENRW